MGLWSLAPALLFLIALPGCGTANSGPTFTNPVYAHDFPDPFVLKVGTSYFAYSTTAGSSNIPMLRSHDLVHWGGPRETMPSLAPWTNGNIWAPSVLRRSDGQYVLYYTGHDILSAKQCIGAAVSHSPSGPFHDRASKPFLCPTTLGGAIDPTIFRDSDGILYLYWKNDGNRCGLTTRIYVQRLAPDGLHLLSQAKRLAVNDQAWEGSVIEGPTMWKQGKSYFLFCSGGAYSTAEYAVGYSLCTSAQGPCTEYVKNPILTSKCSAAGPGGEAIITDGRGQTWMVYHAWKSTAVNSDPGRILWIDRLEWRGSRPSIHGPTCGAQPSPSR
ncbi:MAG: glycoside hydrolase family 43 protein [Chloroflexota bacterium]